MTAHLLRALVPKERVLSYLSSGRGEAVHSTCEYIEETGVEVDAELTRELLRIVESPNDEDYYFSGVDQSGEPMAVDARLAAAVALMLAEPSAREGQNVEARVSRLFPKVVEERARIRMRAMVNTSFGGSHRKSVPFDLEDLDEVLRSGGDDEE